MSNSKLLCGKLQTIDYLNNYAQEKLQLRDYKEAYLAYRECINLTKAILNDGSTSQKVIDKLLPKGHWWLQKATDLKNLLATQDEQSAYKQSAQLGEMKEPLDCESKITEYFNSPKSNHLDEKIKDKIKKFSTILQVSKPTVKFSDIVGSEEAILAARESIVYTLLNSTLQKFRHDQPMGCLLYGNNLMLSLK